MFKINTKNRDIAPQRYSLRSHRAGTSVDDDARKSNNWLDQWQNSKLGTGSRVKSFLCALTSSNDVFVLLLSQPNGDREIEKMGTK